MPVGISPSSFKMSSSPTPIIELDKITKRFPGVLALDQVSLSVLPGEIHAVLGENGAGKSTLMNILAGELQPDEGTIHFNGQPQTIVDAHASQQLGISVVYQELALCPNLSVAENISLHVAGDRFVLSPLNRQKFKQTAAQALARLGIQNVDVTAPVRQYSIAVRQLVEIAKAISVKTKVLILDEPNSALTFEETEHLFRILRQLRAEGVAIIYVSHRLEEVLSLADRITVLRDGRYIETFPSDKVNIDTLIEKMVGRAVEGLYERKTEPTIRETVALRVEDVTGGPRLRGISFQVRAGQVVGIAGLPDSGKDDLPDYLFGIQSLSKGSVRVNGKPVNLRSPTTAIRSGMALIPADRRDAGALLLMSLRDNIAASNLKAVSTLGILQPSKMRALGKRYIEQLDVRTSGLGQQMATLSGGNQQKVILSRGLATDPAVLLLHEPTRGIDVGAKAEIYTILQQLASQGVAVVIISSELPELISQCDQILVMYDGEIKGSFSRAEATQETLLACAMGQMTHFAPNA